MLRTEPKVTTREKFVQYTEGWQTIAGLEPRTTFTTWAVEGDNEPPSSSLPAQIAAKVVEAHWPDAYTDLHWALLQAYFTDNRTISDWQVLGDVVSEVGVDRSEFLAIVDAEGNDRAQLVIDEHNSAINEGITAVPTVVINNVLPVPGAQETDAYINWITRIIDRQAD